MKSKWKAVIVDARQYMGNKPAQAQRAEPTPLPVANRRSSLSGIVFGPTHVYKTEELPVEKFTDIVVITGSWFVRKDHLRLVEYIDEKLRAESGNRRTMFLVLPECDEFSDVKIRAMNCDAARTARMITLSHSRLRLCAEAFARHDNVFVCDALHSIMASWGRMYELVKRANPSMQVHYLAGTSKLNEVVDEVSNVLVPLRLNEASFYFVADHGFTVKPGRDDRNEASNLQWLNAEKRVPCTVRVFKVPELSTFDAHGYRRAILTGATDTWIGLTPDTIVDEVQSVLFN